MLATNTENKVIYYIIIYYLFVYSKLSIYISTTTHITLVTVSTNPHQYL